MQLLSEPTLIVALIEVAIGIVFLTRAADEFVEGAANVASKTKISPVVVGAVIVGFGTSVPELLVSGLAAFNDNLELGIGNIIGSNVANLTLVLGAAALIVPLVVSRSILIREAPLSLLAVLAFAYFTTGGLARWEGLVLLVILVAGLSWVIIGGMGWSDEAALGQAGEATAIRGSNAEGKASTDVALADAPADGANGGDNAGSTNVGYSGPLGPELIRTLLGLVGTVAGAQLLVWGAIAIADEIGLTGGFVGFTLVAVGTSLPELVTAVVAARKGETDLILGNLLGSNMFNSLAVGGTIAVLGPGMIDDEGLRTVGVIVMVLVALFAWFTMVTLRRVHRIEAVVLLTTWLVAVVLLARMSTETALGGLLAFLG